MLLFTWPELYWLIILFLFVAVCLDAVIILQVLLTAVIGKKLILGFIV